MADNLTPKEYNDLGDQYFYGEGQEKNIELAYTYYKKAAYLNNPVGYYNVAKYFIEKENTKQFLENLNKSMELGYSKAAIKLSELYLNGFGVRKSKKKAFKYLEFAVKLNDINALPQLGDFYLEGIGVKKDEKKAYSLYEIAANKNISLGMFKLGVLLLTAKKIKQDFKNGFFWLDKAATSGSIEAINYLKDVYLNGHPFFKKKSKLYMQELWFYYDELLAKQNDVEALRRTAYTYFEGNDFVKINYGKAQKYFEMLYELDDTDGYVGLGLIYLYGLGTDIDYTKAKEFFDVAATRNNTKAMNALGEMFRLGKGVNIDYSRAKDYYFEAAKDDETDALINLGLLNYRRQIPTAKNDLALQYMKTAAEKGNGTAYYWLGIFYDKGIGCKPDFNRAEEYFIKAIENDNLGAKYKYASLLYERLPKRKISKKKKLEQYYKVKDLLLEYVLNPQGNDTNKMYSMYILGEIYFIGYGNLASQKIARYWFEMSAEMGLAKAMVRMYHILIDKEPDNALNWLIKAVKNPTDGEELFELANLYMEGFRSIPKDEMRAKELYGKSSSLGYKPAKEKMTML